MGCVFSAADPTPDGLRIKTQNSVREQGHVIDAKMVLLGNSGVGKSSIATRFCQDTFSSGHEVTIGGAFLSKRVDLPNDRGVNFHIWDTGGQERFRSMARLYYREAQVALVVFDLSEGDPKEAVEYWLTQLNMNGDKGCRVVVVGNKSDKDRDNSAEDVIRMVEKREMPYFECSAKDGSGLLEIFTNCAQHVSAKEEEEA